MRMRQSDSIVLLLIIVESKEGGGTVSLLHETLVVSFLLDFSARRLGHCVFLG